MTKWLSWSYWFSNDSAETTRSLMQAREQPLAKNKEKTDEIALQEERVKKQFEAVKAANPALYETLRTSSATPISTQEMGQLLKNLTLVSAIDSSTLRLYLEGVRRHGDMLEGEVEKWKKIEAERDASIARLIEIEKKDEENLNELKKVQEQVQDLRDSTHSS